MLSVRRGFGQEFLHWFFRRLFPVFLLLPGSKGGGFAGVSPAIKSVQDSVKLREIAMNTNGPSIENCFFYSAFFLKYHS